MSEGMTMPDREKVISAWECCNPFNRNCKECPYEKDCYHDCISRHMVANAIALLKEQEAVEPEVEVLNEIDRLYKCPKCHKHFFYEKQKYCDQCGQEVKW